MEALLGADFPAFLESLSAPAVSGLRLNPLKGNPAELLRRIPYALIPVSWCPTGFYLPQKGGRYPADPSPGGRLELATGDSDVYR